MLGSWNFDMSKILLVNNPKHNIARNSGFITGFCRLRPAIAVRGRGGLQDT